MYVGPNMKCVVCDIDGTLANEKLDDNGNPVRGWYDYDLVHTDVFNKTIFSMVYGLYCDMDANIVFLTARVHESFEVTKQWLEQHLEPYGLEYHHDYVLYTREAGDTRCDAVFKVDTIEREIVPNYGNVLVAFDDRPLVVDSMHDAGINVIAVSDQRVKF